MITSDCSNSSLPLATYMIHVIKDMKELQKAGRWSLDLDLQGCQS